MTKTLSPKRQTKPQVLRTVHDLLRNWNTQHQTLQVEVGIGVVKQVSFGILHELASGKFAVQLARSRSLLLLDDEWERYAQLDNGDDKHGVLTSRKGPNSPWMRLSDDLGEHEDVLRIEPTEADIQTVLRQLTLWAQACTLIIYRSGTDISDVTFVARLVGPGDSDSFLVVGDPKGELPRISRMAGQILLRSAESVCIHREENHVTVALRSGGGNICLVSDVSGSLEDQLMQLRSPSKLQN